MVQLNVRDCANGDLETKSTMLKPPFSTKDICAVAWALGYEFLGESMWMAKFGYFYLWDESRWSKLSKGYEIIFWIGFYLWYPACLVSWNY